METTIEILKPVTIASVAAENPCTTEFRRFVERFDAFGTKEHIGIGEVSLGCYRNPCWKPWLIEKGFIREVEVREKIGVGSLWRLESTRQVYQLRTAGNSFNSVALFCCFNAYEIWRKAVVVKESDDISDKDWEQIVGTGSAKFTRIHGHLEFVEDK